ncbi:MAG: NAD-dependent epimerase/dehydratase family protein [Flavobacteriales bacterium]|nr:NAD-dependent epimerase/dehydratase family protein [Flavobacteriales bacterium]
MNKKEVVLVIGSNGQIGIELVVALRKIYGTDQVIAADIRASERQDGPFEILDVLNANDLINIIRKYNVTQVYLLAAILSATGEKYPEKAWALNMNSLIQILDLAKEKHIQQLYWPSSIAVFGPTTPRQHTPQHTITEPTTVYGISKLAGEHWCNWYHTKYGVDVRSLRYPGLISYTAPPGGGTTDYAVDIFHKALAQKSYNCFLSAETRLPMMYMPDAIRATIMLMQVPADSVKIRTSYNVSSFSFTPAEIANEIKQHIPDFQIFYEPDFRQGIADSWPQNISDEDARRDWNWQPEFSLNEMVFDMIKNLSKR